MHENENILWILTPIQTIYLSKQIKFKFNEKERNAEKVRCLFPPQESKIYYYFVFWKNKKQQQENQRTLKIYFT